MLSGDVAPVGVLAFESSGCEKRPKRELTKGAVEVGAYEVWEVRSGGLLESSEESDMSDVMLASMGSAAACLRGLKVDMLEESVGRVMESCCAGEW